MQQFYFNFVHRVSKDHQDTDGLLRQDWPEQNGSGPDFALSTTGSKQGRGNVGQSLDTFSLITLVARAKPLHVPI